MAPRELPKLVEEALHDMAPRDAGNTLAALVRERLPLLKKQARSRSDAVVNRAALVCSIAGDADGGLALASAYAKALHGYEITSGRDDAEGPVMNVVNWTDIIADEKGRPLEFGKALDRLYSAKSDAEGGVLVIRDIYAQPAQVSDKTALAQAKNGAYQMLHDLLNDYAEKDYTPVIVLTGSAAGMEEYFKKNPGIAQYFTTPTVTAAAPPPPPPPAVDLQAPITVGKPLRLKNPGF